ncbi:flagellar motor switch protein FliG [Sphingomonas vulcanisoli]|uniref:Flagellar motor switch protein FliG n=1 Tax=Sphingomonas vulcanisoli TaxID=1658060 RepID=A0ABX0TVK7_9SPHN|nr:flagellar motor switch protein FliG [Sphingomonas vulcanisoli]NIJ09577.1 flagellar motor switch protein FliG [Sphingomonas vulcanisoli]
MVEQTPVPATDSSPASGSEIAAIMLMLLEESEAAEVIGRLDPEEVERLGASMFSVADVSEREINSVLDEFVRRAKSRTTLGFAADSQIRGMMERALGPDRAAPILGRIRPVNQPQALDSLKWMEPATIASLVEGEHPQLIALVLAHLAPERAAEVLQMLPEDMQTPIIQRVATLGPVSPEAIEDIERLLTRPLRRPQSAAIGRPRGGVSEAAQIVNNSRKASEQRILKALQKLDKNLARSIEDEMFVFENLNALDDKNLGMLLRAVESDILVVSLKGADERLKARMFGCMSSRAAQSIQDAITDKGPMRMADVQIAQKEMLSIARRLAAEGTINLGGKGDDDYV